LYTGATTPQEDVQFDRFQLQSDQLAGPTGGGHGEVTAVSVDMDTTAELLGIHKYQGCSTAGAGRRSHPGYLPAVWRQAGPGKNFS
jgi:hypothetical protein